MGLLPPLRGIIDRRILVNFRIDPDAIRDAELLPDGFRPRTVDGVAIGGICCIRLADIRPVGLPTGLGLSSENAAHRIGVEWDEDASEHDQRKSLMEDDRRESISENEHSDREDGEQRTGVYIPRRDTNSLLNSFIGSRVFGRHYQASFQVSEGDGRYELTMRSPNGPVMMHVEAREPDTFPENSVFEDTADASAYHQCGSVGYCPSPDESRLQGVELTTDEWQVQPLAVESVSASFFETRLPADAVEFDNALLMDGIGHQWDPRPSKPTSAAPF